MTSDVNAAEMNLSRARMLLEDVPGVVVSGDGLLLTVEAPVDKFATVAALLKERLGCLFFAFLTAIDHKDAGLEVVARIDNLDSKVCVMLRTKLGVGNTHCPSLYSMYRGANWMERECFDMFGILFDGHPDLRRMLLPEDWKGHPLLKSYAVDTPYPPYR
jgi:NADH-quinone oxidoreductase subunit C